MLNGKNKVQLKVSSLETRKLCILLLPELSWANHSLSPRKQVMANYIWNLAKKLRGLVQADARGQGQSENQISGEATNISEKLPMLGHNCGYEGRTIRIKNREFWTDLSITRLITQIVLRICFMANIFFQSKHRLT